MLSIGLSHDLRTVDNFVIAKLVLCPQCTCQTFKENGVMYTWINTHTIQTLKQLLNGTGICSAACELTMNYSVNKEIDLCHNILINISVSKQNKVFIVP